jgi:hypothetical protein
VRCCRYTHVFLTLAKAAARRGLLVVLGADRLRADVSPGHAESGRWTSGALTEELELRSWQRLAHIACGQWNVVGVDLFAQPYKASWGSGDPANDWNSAAERLGNGVLKLCPRWLIFVQGVGEEPGAGPDQDTAGGVFWGENIYGARAHPVVLSDPTKLVYAPQTFGPSTATFPFFEYGKFPANMPQVWTRKVRPEPHSTHARHERTRHARGTRTWASTSLSNIAHHMVHAYAC